MTRIINELLKIIIMFILCTTLFYYGIKFIHQEFKQLHKYDVPQGPAIKVFQSDTNFFDRLNLFFQIGE